MSAKLTSAQRGILDFLEERISSGEPAPTYQEICDRFGYRSPRAATDHVAALEKKGYVTRKRGLARSLRPVRQQVGIPLLGRIVAGLPDDTLTTPEERINLDPANYGIRDRSRSFALRVIGDSMVGRQIFDGDLVLLERKIEPRDGDIVAALIDNNSTLKTFIRKKGRALLRAENPLFPDLIPAFDLEIQGVARAVIRFL